MSVTEDRLLEMTVDIVKAAASTSTDVFSKRTNVPVLIREVYKALSDINEGKPLENFD